MTPVAYRTRSVSFVVNVELDHTIDADEADRNARTYLQAAIDEWKAARGNTSGGVRMEIHGDRGTAPRARAR
jgi:hypothetical protein